MNHDEFHDIESQLDDIAKRDRALASRDFESRVSAAVLREVRAHANKPSIKRFSLSSLLAGPMRVAAAIAIVGAVFAAYLADKSREARVNAESVAVMMSDVEVMLAIAAELDQERADELAMLHSQATTLGEKVRGGISDLIDEGAM